ncbi:MAG: phosphatidate cytidylyltransferase [Pseudomonadota bacterium]
MNASGEKHHIFNHELKLRVISGLILAALVLSMTWIGGLTFTLLWAVAAFAIFYEFTRICKTNIEQTKVFAGYGFILLTMSAWIFENQALAYQIFLVAVVLNLFWERVSQQPHWVSLGVAYALLPFFAMSELRDAGDLGLFFIFLLFACVWGADILAYFFGKGIGGPKLAPRISPKKTWSGFIGGILGAVGLCFVVTKFFGFSFTSNLMLLTVLLAIFSQVGDLMESLLKRLFDVKDSGNLIPGHGGVLDRIDGLIVAGVTLWGVMKLMQIQDGSDITLSELFRRVILMP